MKNSKGFIDVETLKLDDIINDEVDFLKMDIEGAETDVLLSSKKLDQINQMFIEYHSFHDSDQKLSQLLEVLSQNRFRYYTQEIFCPNNPFLKTESFNRMDLQLNIFAIKNV